MPSINFTDAEIAALRNAVKEHVQADDEYISNHDPIRSGLVKLNKASEINQEVKNYAASVIDAHQATPGQANKVVYEEAQRAAENGMASFTAAAKVAHTAIAQYDEARGKGHDHTDAQEKVSQAMGRKFDDHWRDTQRQDRQSQSQSQSQ